MFSRTRYGLSVFCLSAAVAVLTNTSGVASAQGLVEPATGNAMRPKFSSRDVRASRGRFTFPAPYNTEAVRLTEASDCGGGDCVLAVGYSYWSNINNHTGSDTMLIFLGLRGPGPTLFSYNKNTGETRNRGSLFDGDNTFGWARLSTGEGWYFSATKPNALYINEPVGSRLFRYDVIAHTWETVFDAAGSLPGKYIWQVHSSNDDRVHSFTVRDKGPSYTMEGCAIYREDQQKFVYWRKKGNDFDECQIDKSGKWLLIKEDLNGDGGEDNRVIDVDSNTERILMNADGAAGHSDMGYGYLVADDNFHSQPGAVRVWDFSKELRGGQPVSPIQGQGTLVYQMSTWAVGQHLANGNSKPGIPLDQQMACTSSGYAATAARINEVVCFRLNDSLNALIVAPTLTDLSAPGGGSEEYWKFPKGNLDITGEYFIWTANAGTSRLDAYIVKIPVDKLGVSTSGSPAANSSASGSSSSSSQNPPSSSNSGGTANAGGTWTGESGVVLPGDQNGPNSIPAGDVKYEPRKPAPAPTPAPTPAPAPSNSGGNAVPVQWTSVQNAAAMGSTLMKNGGCSGCPDAGAVSVQKIASGDGYVEFSVPETGTLRFIGLSTGNSGTDPSEIRFALRLQNGVAEVRESGAYRGEIGFSAADTLRVAFVGGRVQYSKNGSVFHTSSAGPAYPALVDTSLFDANATIMNVMIKGAK